MQQGVDQPSGKPTQFRTFKKWCGVINNSSQIIQRTSFGLFAYIPLGLLFLWIELKQISDNAKGSSANYFPWFTIAVFFLPFTLMLVAVLDAAYRLTQNKSSGIRKGYGAVFCVLLLSLVTGWVAVNGERYGRENTILPLVAFVVWVIYNLLMFISLYLAMKAFKNQNHDNR